MPATWWSTAGGYLSDVVLPRVERADDADDSAAPQPRTTLVHFLLSTGYRIAEACALDRADFRLSQFRVLGKGGKYRTVYCTVGALAAVQDYLQARGPDPSPALFISVARKDLYRGKAKPGNRLALTAPGWPSRRSGSG